MKRIRRFIRAQSGQDAVEYGLLAAFISIVATSVLLEFGPWLKPVYYTVQDAVRRAATFQPGSPGNGSGDDLPGQ